MDEEKDDAADDEDEEEQDDELQKLDRGDWEYSRAIPDAAFKQLVLRHLAHDNKGCIKPHSHEPQPNTDFNRTGEHLREECKPAAVLIRMKHELNLAAMYGPNFGATFVPTIRNIATRAIMARNVHCGSCQRKITKQCYEDLHLGFCTAEMKREEGQMDICGERFVIESNKGCGTHFYHNGYNLDLRAAGKGYDPKPDKENIHPADEVVAVEEPPRPPAEDEELNLQPWLQHNPAPVFKQKPEPRDPTKTKKGRQAGHQTYKQIVTGRKHKTRHPGNNTAEN